MISQRLREKIALIIIITCATLIATILISYYTVYKFVAPNDPMIYGQFQSKIAWEIRNELLQRNDIEEITILTSDHLSLAALLITREHPQGNMLVCHGYRGCKEFMYNYIDLFPDYNILMIDFRAHGKSTGEVISLGCHEYKDVIAGANFFHYDKKFKNLPLVILGISMGGASVIKAADIKKDLCQALIIDSVFSDLPEMFICAFSLRMSLPYYPFFPLLQSTFNYFACCDSRLLRPAESVSKIKQPIFFIHSCNDAFIDPKNSLALYAQAQHKKTKLWIGPQSRHGWLHVYHADLYKKKVTSFLQQIII